MSSKREIIELRQNITRLHGGRPYGELPPDVQQEIIELRRALLGKHGLKYWMVVLVTSKPMLIVVGDHTLSGPFDLCCSNCGRADGQLHQPCKKAKEGESGYVSILQSFLAEG